MANQGKSCYMYVIENKCLTGKGGSTRRQFLTLRDVRYGSQWSGLSSSANGLRRNRLGPRPQPPDQSAANHQSDRDPLCACDGSAKYRSASRIVAEIFKEETRNSIDK